MKNLYVTNGRTALLALAAVSIACVNASAQSDDKRSCTPDRAYCVSIIEKKLPKAPQEEDRQLVLHKHGKPVARYPTYGYLLDVYWSPDQKYVAINNRRANSGDYLWVISLADGKAIKMPSDLAEELKNNERGEASGDKQPLEPEVMAKYPQCTIDTINHAWLTARGWKNASELEVSHRITCFHFDATIQVDKVYKIEGTGVRMVSQTVSETNGADGR